MEFKDLTGDPVYDHFKAHMKEGIQILGGKIIEHKTYHNHGPRREIEVQLTDGKITEIYKYNYNKLLKELNKTSLILDPTKKESTGSIIL